VRTKDPPILQLPPSTPLHDITLDERDPLASKLTIVPGFKKACDDGTKVSGEKPSQGHLLFL